jgi:hypothetical protein
MKGERIINKDILFNNSVSSCFLEFIYVFVYYQEHDRSV